MKWNSQVTVNRDREAERESERDRERDRGEERRWEEWEYINRLPVTSLFFQGVRFLGQVSSLWLSVRSILFALAWARATAINWSEFYEPLIRLANGACNLAAAEPTALWIADTVEQRLKKTWGQKEGCGGDLLRSERHMNLFLSSRSFLHSC